ncbi:MAG: formate--tetrahydrofolate ligase [Vicinamibacteria bacterium]|nr:formate--tetrahydrofolate ligase [Vicinamibacteria bacterium]
MAVLCLSKDRDDLRVRLGRMIVAVDREGVPVTANDLKATGALMILLKDAIQPNLVQTWKASPRSFTAGLSRTSPTDATPSSPRTWRLPMRTGRSRKRASVSTLGLRSSSTSNAPPRVSRPPRSFWSPPSAP